MSGLSAAQAGILMIILQSIIYGLLDPFSKLAYQVIPVLSFLWVRYIVAAGFMLLIWHKPILADLHSVPLKKYIVPALCMGCAFIISNTGLLYTSVANVGFVRSTTPIVVSLMLLLFFHKHFPWYSWLNLALVMLGIFLLGGGHGISSFGLGELYAFGGTVLVAGSLVFGTDALKSIKAITLSFVQTVCSIFVCPTAALLQGSLQTTPWQHFLEPSIIGTLLYASLFCTVAGYQLQNMALERISSKKISMFQCSYPVTAAIVAFIVLGESMSFISILGAALICCCVIAECYMK